MASENFDSDEQDEIQRLAKAVASVLWTDEDADNLLETDKEGIDVSTVNTESLQVRGAPVVAGDRRSDVALNFKESDLSLSTTDTIVSDGWIALKGNEEVIDDFEDNDDTVKNANWSGWNGDTGSLTAQTNTIISGNYTGNLDAGGGEDKSVNASRNSETQPDKIELSIQFDNKESDQFSIYLYDSGGSRWGRILLRHGGDLDVYGSGTTVQSWSTNTTYNIVIEPDFGNNTFNFTVNGTDHGSFSHENNGDDFKELQLRNNNGGGSNPINAYLDDIKASGEDATSGDAILEWPHPTDLYEWLTATYTKSPDGETVDVFVAYSDDDGSTWQRTNGGNPISRQYDLKNDANISDSSEVRIEAELSRSDTSNNPTLDSAYRTWQL